MLTTCHARFYPGRIVGGNCDYRHLNCLVAPRHSSGAETANITQCKNNLKQIGLAFQVHNSTNKFFPTGGWGWNWTGDPDQGYGKLQPGGWAYNILPFMEETAIHDLGKGQPAGTAQKLQALGQQAVRHCVDLLVLRDDLNSPYFQFFSAEPDRSTVISMSLKR